MRSIGGIRKLTCSLIFLISVLLAGSFIITAHAQDNAVEHGQALFEETNCLMCHLLNGEGGGLDEAPNLAGVKTRKDKAQLIEWLNTHLLMKTLMV